MLYLISEPIPSCLQSFYFRITRSSFPVPDLSPDIVAVLERKNEEEKKKGRRGRRGDRGRMHINFHYNSVCYYCLQVVPLYFYVSLININFYLNQVTLLCLHLLFTLQKCHLTILCSPKYHCDILLFCNIWWILKCIFFVYTICSTTVTNFFTKKDYVSISKIISKNNLLLKHNFSKQKEYSLLLGLQNNI